MFLEGEEVVAEEVVQVLLLFLLVQVEVVVELVFYLLLKVLKIKE